MTFTTKYIKKSLKKLLEWEMVYYKFDYHVSTYVICSTV